MWTGSETCVCVPILSIYETISITTSPGRVGRRTEEADTEKSRDHCKHIHGLIHSSACWYIYSGTAEIPIKKKEAKKRLFGTPPPFPSMSSDPRRNHPQQE